DETSPRLLYGANDKLIELDPLTGNLIESFGNKGVLDVHPGQPANMPAPTRGAASDADPSTPREPQGRPEQGRGATSSGQAGGRGSGPGGRGGRGEGAAFGSGFSISSPPAIYKNFAILGGSEGENAAIGPAGDP